MPPELNAVTFDGTRCVPITWVSAYVFVQVRSRKLVYERLSRARPMLPLTRKSGKRAVIVLVFRPLPVTQRNSGSYCAYTDARLPTSSAAGLIGELASKSASDPPVASARVLSSPPGYPNPWMLTAPWANIAGADTQSAVATAARERHRIRAPRSEE